MPKKLKLLTVVGTRPELIRLSETIKKADKYFEHILAHTGQNYDTNLNDIFYDDLGIRKPDFYLNVPDKTLGATIGNIISRSYDLMQETNPDALLILGDTNSALCAITAKRLKIPIFHMEAGNRCFDENLPEEINRRIVDHISDINLPYTEHARRYLIGEGIRKEYIFVTGSPLKEVIMAHKEQIDNDNVTERLGLTKNKYMVLSAHREENIDNAEQFRGLIKAINALAETYAIPVIYSLHPRSADRLKKQNIAFHPLVREMRPFNFTDYSALMKNSFCVISDSGTIPEEAAIEKFPAVCIRTSTERPEAIDRGGIVMGGVIEKNVLGAVRMAVAMASENERIQSVPDYEIDNVSSTVIKIIQSYMPIVNDKIWRKTQREQ